MTRRCTRCRKLFEQTDHNRRCKACVDYYAAYYTANKEREIARHAEWAEKNKAYLAAYQQQRRKRPRTAERIRAQERERIRKPHRRGMHARHYYKWHIKHKYQLTLEQFDALRESQLNLCAICKEPMAVPHVDHCHTTGRVRSLLCSGCHRGIGCFKEDTQRMRRAVRYLDLQAAHIKLP